MPTPDAPEAVASIRWLPWRSATLGWVVAAVALVAGVPLFLCMPPWTDATLHDMIVRSILHGGVLYRDVFDTNLPGIDWATVLVRVLFGWSYEALRAADLVVIAAEVWLLVGWVRRAGAANYTIAWLVASAAMFYPFTSEFNHIQRDPWLLLPALVAARLRLARVLRPNPPASFPHREGGASGKPNPPAPFPPREGGARVSPSPLGGGVGEGFPLLEGIAWGAAVWVKPHVIVPAFALWIVSAILIARRESGRRVLRDLAGLIVGGGFIGAAGIAWLIETGAWPYFLDVFLNWNPNYMTHVIGEAGSRFDDCFTSFRPWGLLYYVALPLAVLALWEARVWSRQPGEPRKVLGSPYLYMPAETESVASARAMLAALFLGWFAQAIVLQKGFDYVQVPVMFLAMGMIATQRWAFGFAYFVWFVLLGLLLNFTDLVPPNADPAPGIPVFRLEHQPFTDPQVMKLWPRCWRECGSPELQDRLRQFGDVFCSTNWENLSEVARFLKSIDPPLGPRELNCWHDSTHPLYLMLDLDPATRYMHYDTVFGISSKNNWIAEQIAREVAASPQRYVVSDLARMTYEPKQAFVPGAGGDPLRLPPWFPLSQRSRFPWNQPIVFRSGRYLVHKVVNPLGPIDIPDWSALGSLGPGE